MVPTWRVFKTNDDFCGLGLFSGGFEPVCTCYPELPQNSAPFSKTKSFSMSEVIFHTRIFLNYELETKNILSNLNEKNNGLGPSTLMTRA